MMPHRTHRRWAGSFLAFFNGKFAIKHFAVVLVQPQRLLDLLDFRITFFSGSPCF